MSDLKKRLRIIAGMLHVGEKIRWGTDAEALDDALTEIERLEAEVERLEEARDDALLQDRDHLLAEVEFLSGKLHATESLLDRAMKLVPDPDDLRTAVRALEHIGAAVCDDAAARLRATLPGEGTK